MATAYLSPIERIMQVFADQGMVHAGYKVNIYAPGSAIPLTTYSDAILSSPNDNPIVLLADGRLPASIWAPSGTALKVVITNPQGRPVPGGTCDNLSLIDDTFSSLHP